jgi:hypothetical protein
MTSLAAVGCLARPIMTSLSGILSDLAVFSLLKRKTPAYVSYLINYKAHNTLSYSLFLQDEQRRRRTEPGNPENLDLPKMFSTFRSKDLPRTLRLYAASSRTFFEMSNNK